MATTSDYLTQLQTDKQNYINKFNELGVEVPNNATFTEMLPKFDELPSGGITPSGEISITENGTYDVTNYASANVNVASEESSSGFTGQYDRVGLKSLGYTDEEVDYYNKNGVVWNSEYDDAFKVTSVDIANKDKSSARFVPIPINMNIRFYNYRSLLTIPNFNTSSRTDFSSMFNGDWSLKCIPLLDTSKGTSFADMFSGCRSLLTIPQINTIKGTAFQSMFNYCYSLAVLPQLNTSNGKTFGQMFSQCNSLTKIPQLNMTNATSHANMFQNCSGLTHLGGLLNLGNSYLTTTSANNANYKLTLSDSPLLTHDSLMNVINGLYDIQTKGVATQQLTIGSTNLAKLTAEEIAIATNKGWTVS